MNKIKVMSVFGTRPEAIKMAPLVKELEKNEQIKSIVCVTAQHREMLDQVLEIFDLHPAYDLDIMQTRQTLAGITTRALTGLEEVMAKEKPDIVLVHGDTSTTFAGALAAYYNQTKVGHVEAGLRTYDKYQPFPEEMNRRLTGALTDLHFSPTPLAKEHLLKENIDESTIFVTGNTVIDALAHTIEEEYTFSVEELNQIDFENKRVIAMTAHRRENLGEPLENICRSVKRLVEEYPDVEVVYAVHKNPAVMEPVNKILGQTERIHLTDPLDLKDMHNLMCRSYLVLTDSGGLQEEVPSMGKPVLVLRNVTERPEGVEAGTLKLVGTDEEMIYITAKELLDNEEEYAKMAQAKNPFGDGQASRRIVESILFAFGISGNRPDEYNIYMKSEHKEERPMKDERMAVLNMLEKGIINAQEAERLLLTLQGGMGLDKEKIGKTMGDALGKAGDAFQSVAKVVGEQAEKIQPTVKDMANKVSEKAEDFEPAVRSAAFRMAEMMDGLKADVKNYREKMKEKKARDQAEDWSQTDQQEMAEEDGEQDANHAEVVPLLENTAPQEEEEYAKNVEAVLNSLQMQLTQIDDAESFLKSTFGNVDLDDWEEDEENIEANQVAEELVEGNLSEETSNDEKQNDSEEK
ncbi:non-hydrolyzing UDP-N-acetylglucosamine 2-epimerase [Anaerotignum sp. MB30-C6]|uniref:non-hydrolyzing UDP-N-acetylglucosamine 2-epimerase n=1 Tax=Anaerotignum sp. MB30-C6 TaxID=3070814 RepID=UPI002F3FCD96